MTAMQETAPVHEVAMFKHVIIFKKYMVWELTLFYVNTVSIQGHIFIIILFLIYYAFLQSFIHDQ